jgi:hypothetical protein
MAHRRGGGAQLAVLDELCGGAWELPTFDASDLAKARDLVRD